MKRLLTTISLIIATSIFLVACGPEPKKDEAVKEGAWVTVQKLSYQVQMSRQLNAKDTEDRDYLGGLKAADRKLGQGETFFGVFIKAQNITDQDLRSAEEFEITDTQKRSYKPLALARTNVFAYRPATVFPDGWLPKPNSAAANGPIQGSLILFKVNEVSFQDRPMVLEIKQGGESATIDLDV